MKIELGAIVENHSAKILTLGFMQNNVCAWMEDREAGDYHVFFSYSIFHKLYRGILQSLGVELDPDNREQHICLFGRDIWLRQGEIRGAWRVAAPGMPWYIEATALPLIERKEN